MRTTMNTIEITIKLNKLPQIKYLTPHQILITIKYKQWVIQAKIKNSSWKRALKRTEEIENWTMAIKGQLKPRGHTGIELEHTALQVF